MQKAARFIKRGNIK